MATELTVPSAAAVVDSIDPASLEHSMAEAVAREVPVYAALKDTPIWPEVEAHCGEHVRATMRSLRGRQPPTRDELGFVVEHAKLRARQGVPLAAMLHSYRVGYASVWRAISDAAAQVGAEPDAILVLGESAMDYFNAISGSLTEAYLREQHVLERGRAHELAEVTKRLLAGDPDVMTERAALLAKCGFGRDRAIAVASVHTQGAAVHAGLSARLSAALEPKRSALVSDTHERIVAVVPLDAVDEDPRFIADAIHDACADAEFRAGVSLPWPALSDAPAAFADAERAVERSSEERPVVVLSELALLDDLIGRADRTSVRLVDLWVEELRDEDLKLRGELLETMQTYLDEEFSVARAAKRLEVHPNTVRYRLGRIESVTGKSVRRFDDLVEIVISLRLTDRPRG